MLAQTGSFIPHISIDCVIFGYHDQQLKVLVLKFRNTNHYSLPGGFIKNDEDITEAANRVLRDRTGLDNVYMEQFQTFGNPARHDLSILLPFLEANHLFLPEDHWMLRRFISIGYYALVDFSKVEPTADLLSDWCGWYPINRLPALIIDHGEMVAKAWDTLKLMLDHKLVGFNLLSDTFTMNELQGLYETILEKKLVRPNFQQKMLSLGILERVEKKYTGKAYKAPYLYRFYKGDHNPESSGDN